MISEGTTTDRLSGGGKRRVAVAVAFALVTIGALATAPRAQSVDSTAATAASMDRSASMRI